MQVASDRLMAWFTTSDAVEKYQFVLSPNAEHPNPLFTMKRRTPKRREKFRQRMEAVFKEPHRVTSDGRNAFSQELIALGTDCAAFLPKELVALLFESTHPLVIETNDPVFPWELLYHNKQFLGTLRPIGRLGSVTSANYRPVGTWNGLHQATLIGNTAPAQGGGSALTFPKDEVDAIQQVLERMTPPYPAKPLTPDGYRHDTFTQVLNRHNVILHYAGHVLMSKDGSSDVGIGLQTSDGRRITAHEVAQSHGRFLFVFLNGCHSGAMDELSLLASGPGQSAILASATEEPILKGLAMAFREHGSVAVICTLWPVDDGVALQIAEAVYRGLAIGWSVGESLQRARAALHGYNGHDSNWAAYVLYGDPTLTLAAMQGGEQGTAAAHVAALDLTAIFAHGRAAHQRRNADDVQSGTVDDIGREDSGVDESEIIDLPLVPPSLPEQRIEQILAASSIDAALPPAPDLNDALETTCQWLQREDWNLMARVDLLVGLALMPNSPVAAALVAVGCSASVLASTTHASFGRGTKRGHAWSTEPFECSPRISRAIGEAAAVARREGSGTVTARHLALALLAPPVTGSIHDVLEKILGIPGERLLEALRTGNAPTSPPPGTPPMPITLGEREIHNARLPIDLIEREAMLSEHDLCEPLAARPDQVEALVKRLRLPTDHHVLLTGPHGVGKQSLITLLARYLPDHQGQVALAGIQGWGIFTLPLQPGGEQGTWLQATVAQLMQRHGPSIIVFPSLGLLLDDATIMAALPQIVQQPSLRCIVLATEAEAERLRQQQRALLQIFTPVPLAAPRPEVATQWLTLRLDYLGRRANVTFAPDAVAVATKRATNHQTQTALPGLVQAYLLAAGSLAFDEARQGTWVDGVLPLVTADHVNRAQLP